jgi:hypothetical protein
LRFPFCCCCTCSVVNLVNSQPDFLTLVSSLNGSEKSKFKVSPAG